MRKSDGFVPPWAARCFWEAQAEIGVVPVWRLLFQDVVVPTRPQGPVDAVIGRKRAMRIGASLSVGGGLVRVLGQDVGLRHAALA